MQVATFLREVFKSKRQKTEEAAREKLGSIKTELLVLKKTLEAIANTRSSDHLGCLHVFFSTVSPWHDRGLDDIITAFEEADKHSGLHSDIIFKLVLLNMHFENAGRCMSRMNRTKPGEHVSIDKIFLGDIYGLHTKPLTFWFGRRNEPRDEWKGTIYGEALAGMNAFDVVSEQARRFMNTHVGPMIKLIDDLYQY